MNATADLPDLARRLSDLPPLPAALTEVIRALRDGGLSMTRCVELIERDPALAARTLRLANSAFYGRPGRVGSVTGAVMMLGLRTVMGLLTAASLQGCIPAPHCPGFDRDAHWSHAMATAMAASLLAPRVDLDPSEAFLAGLLHDIGELMLAVLAPDQMGQVLARGAAGEDAAAVERELLGTDHLCIGADVARLWHFPPAIVEAIALHGDHHLPPPGRPVVLAELLALCDALLSPLEAGLPPEAALAQVPEAAWQLIQVDDSGRLALLETLAAGMQSLQAGG